MPLQKSKKTKDAIKSFKISFSNDEQDYLDSIEYITSKSPLAKKYKIIIKIGGFLFSAMMYAGFLNIFHWDFLSNLWMFILIWIFLIFDVPWFKNIFRGSRKKCIQESYKNILGKTFTLEFSDNGMKYYGTESVTEFTLSGIQEIIETPLLMLIKVKSGGYYFFSKKKTKNILSFRRSLKSFAQEKDIPYIVEPK